MESDARIEVGRLPVVIAESSKSYQLFQNLFSNATKYRSFDHKPVIQIDCNDNESEWCISVRDNRVGIESENSEKVFVMFQGIPTGEKRNGTGVGLAICKKVVTDHSGAIWLESTPGAGPIFYSTLPKPADPQNFVKLLG